MHTGFDHEAAQPRLQEARLEAVVGALAAARATSVLDLGCGTGDLLSELVRIPGTARIIGVDLSVQALDAAAQRLAAAEPQRQCTVELAHASFTEPPAGWAGFDAAVLMETIEHVEPERLSAVERAVFGACRPGLVLVTTPNREWNGLLGVPPGGVRHPDHRFEWPRARFAAWARGVARRNGYTVTLQGIGAVHPLLGCPTQMAEFAMHT